MRTLCSSFLVRTTGNNILTKSGRFVQPLESKAGRYEHGYTCKYKYQGWFKYEK